MNEEKKPIRERADEIKAALVCGGVPGLVCEKCRYATWNEWDGVTGCRFHVLENDAFDLIEALETELTRARLERDAAVEDMVQAILGKTDKCRLCKHLNTNPFNEPCVCCDQDIDDCAFEWRGLQGGEP